MELEKRPKGVWGDPQATGNPCGAQIPTANFSAQRRDLKGALWEEDRNRFVQGDGLFIRPLIRTRPLVDTPRQRERPITHYAPCPIDERRQTSAAGSASQGVFLANGAHADAIADELR